MSKQLHATHERTTRPTLSSEDHETLQTFAQEDLESLLNESEAPSVTLLMPTHRAHPENAQDPIRFRNLVSEIEAQLEGQDVPESLIDRFRALEDEAFWQHQKRGLAVFATPNRFDVYQLDVPLSEVAHVGERFLLTPLVKLLQENRGFYALSVSKNAVTLFKGSQGGLVELSPTPIPSSLRDALGHETFLPHRDHHSAQRGGGRAIHHGHGGSQEESEDVARRFLREVANGVWEVLKDEDAPLVLGATEAYHSLFQEVCRYPHLCEEGVLGNLDHEGVDTLHERFWAIARRACDDRDAGLSEHAEHALNKDMASADLAQISRAMLEGRLETLLVSTACIHDVELSQVVYDALRVGVNVVTRDEADMPRRARCVGLFRWAAA